MGIADLCILADNYGAGGGTVPEPAALSLLAIAAPAMIRRRRRVL
ncbi:MAG: PEP-CTERM sorting domain-containing protein [Planctomycetota bacterium]